MQEAKALAHPLRVRILRLCAGGEPTNKQLADRLGRERLDAPAHGGFVVVLRLAE